MKPQERIVFVLLYRTKYKTLKGKQLASASDFRNGSFKISFMVRVSLQLEEAVDGGQVPLTALHCICLV